MFNNFSSPCFGLVIINTMNDERNFRSLYYEKVGCKSIEEKKALEILFKDKLFDKSKFGQFCSRFTVPFVYRSYVWKLLLGVLPVHKSCHEFVMRERTKQYTDLLSSFNAINFYSNDIPKEEVIIQMWLMERGNLMLDRKKQLKMKYHQNMLAITRTLVEIFDNDIDTYWIARGFFEYIRTWYASIPYLVDTTKSLLMREDVILFKHLEAAEVLDKIPMDMWFGRCFAGILHDNAAVKVWDKVIGGSYRVLIYVCCVLLTRMRRVLLSSVNITQFLSCVQSVTNETADVVVSKAIELWQINGRSIIPSPVRDVKPPPTRPRGRSIFNS